MKPRHIVLALGTLFLCISADKPEGRWGAIAVGGNGFGATRNRPDEASAVAGALRQCQESGGADECRIRLTYRDRCAAYATGANRQVGIAYAATMAKAGSLALRSCKEASKGCQIQYAACSVAASFN